MSSYRPGTPARPRAGRALQRANTQLSRAPTSDTSTRVRSLVMLLLICGCATPPPVIERGDFDGLKRSMRARIDEEMRASGATTLAIAVVSKDGPIWIECFGPCDADSKFRVGSLSKMVTSLTTLAM